MNTRLDDLLSRLRAAQGDPGQTALAVADFACAGLDDLSRALAAAAVPHWFTRETLAALLDEDLKPQVETLHSRLVALPMVQSYAQRQAHAVHDQTRLALRERLWQNDPERFKELSRRAASSYGSTDDTAPDFVLTCEHLYHQLAGQTEAGDTAMATVADNWRNGLRTERLQSLARLLDELVAVNPSPPLLPRGRARSLLAIADAREKHQPRAATQDLVFEAETILSSLAERHPENAELQNDLLMVLCRQGELGSASDDLTEPLRDFTKINVTHDKAPRKRDKPSSTRRRADSADPADADWQRAVSLSLNKASAIATAQTVQDKSPRSFMNKMNRAILESAPDKLRPFIPSNQTKWLLTVSGRLARKFSELGMACIGAPHSEENTGIISDEPEALTAQAMTQAWMLAIAQRAAVDIRQLELMDSPPSYRQQAEAEINAIALFAGCTQRDGAGGRLALALQNVARRTLELCDAQGARVQFSCSTPVQGISPLNAQTALPFTACRVRAEGLSVVQLLVSLREAIRFAGGAENSPTGELLIMSNIWFET